MKKVFLLLGFTLMTTFAWAGEPVGPTEPIKKTTSETTECREKEVVAPQSGCTYCSSCGVTVVCVVCTCGNCNAELDFLWARLCQLGCCYSNM